jgi:hypothetical protein
MQEVTTHRFEHRYALVALEPLEAR